MDRYKPWRWLASLVGPALWLTGMVFSPSALAVPSFATQTGQNCAACHAGGQYPELTSFGRAFKLGGYTLGQRGNPLAGMLVASQTRTRDNSDGAGGALSTLDGQSIIDFGSVFLAGKVNDKVGGFAQFTYSFYDSQNPSGTWNGYGGADNMDFRYADHTQAGGKDLLFGLSANNSPSVQDVWNSTPAWGYPYVSTTQGPFGGAPAGTLVEGGLAQQVAGLGAFAYWNGAVYAELSSYQTAKGPWAFMSLGSRPGDVDHPLTHLDGNAPYWRLAYNHEWGAHSLMVGAFGLDAKILPLDAAALPIDNMGNTHYRDTGLDAQYQYMEAQHTFTAHIRSIRENIDDATLTAYAGPATLNTLNAKASYVYRNEFGGSLAYTGVTGSADATAYADSALASPDTEVWTPELFWLAKQNLRVGVQFSHFTKYLGASSNYDGAGRNASDNDTTYLYLWTAL
jgi:hypothetical protein